MSSGLPSLAVVVLAGGEGRRIGGGKPERLLGAERLIDHALRQARRWSAIIGVACGTQPLPDIGIVPQLLDEQGAGPISGLLAGIYFALEADAPLLLTIPSDTPFLPSDLPDRRLAAIGGNGAAIPLTGSQLHPSCGLWRTDTGPQIIAYLADGRRSMIGLAERIGYSPVAWPEHPFDRFFNINSAEDLASAEKLLKNR